MFLGLDGVNGTDPPRITDLNELEKFGYTIKDQPIHQRFNGIYVITYHIDGIRPKYPTDGEDGGCGAPGGYPGKSFIFGFENADNFIVFNAKGI